MAPRSLAFWSCTSLWLCCCTAPPPPPPLAAPAQYANCKPWTRWWWFAGEIAEPDVVRQLDWLAANGFGGIEIAFVYPHGGDEKAPRLPWLSPEWSARVAFARREATARGLGCDFTFGTLWPFGDSQVPAADGALLYGEAESPLRMRLTWEHPSKGRVLDHLDRQALRRYADRLGPAFAPALQGGGCGLFCDSWEVETKWIWTKGFAERFRQRHGYDVAPFMGKLLEHRDVLYDWFALVSDLVLDEFYAPFTAICHELGASSRAQCGGAPADLLSAFARVDVPETEAILYEPGFARIPASAAALSGKGLVASETFTCIYGWKGWPGPGPHQGEERVADLKLVADALFAHGVNHVVWHGMPFQTEGGRERFYASVHVGPDSAFAAELPAFNHYLETVSRALRRGRVWSDVAVVLPVEDAWCAGEYPKELQFPWVWGQYELRYVAPAAELQGRQPLWINGEFLRSARWQGGRLVAGAASFGSLYVDVEFLALESLRAVVALAEQGLPVCLKRAPQQPGRAQGAEYGELLRRLAALPNVRAEFAAVAGGPPLLRGEDLPDAWCREDGDGLTLFFANPDARALKYPLAYGQAAREQEIVRNVTIHAFGRDVAVELRFPPDQSLLLRVGRDGSVAFEDVGFVPARVRR
ncbi:MAG: hypothetical protein FJ265_03660 [Planctomycetes bacterium]|nr:hypothetical protein [Planctomycetota bacterium]